MTIFIVDDEPKIRNGMGKLLSAHPRWQVQTFADAKSALHRLYEGAADVIITDIQMPDASGLDMIEAVRQVNKTVPILILSGYSRFDYAQRAIESGVRKYLTKPTNPVDLIAALEQIEQEQSEQIQRLQRQAQKKPDLKPVDNLLVLRAIEYLQAHYAERIGLAQTAQALYISPNYLSELFRKTTGMRFTEYLLQLRLDKSRAYLCDVRYRVSDVTQMVGFQDARYFSISFKKRFHLTPMEYRNRYAGSHTPDSSGELSK